jgi:Concanavalin A-like lectin/glucanases superfamily
VSPPSTLTTIFNHGVTDGVQVQLTHGQSVAAFRNAAITRFSSGVYQALQFSTPAANQIYLWNATFDGSRMNVSVDGRAVTGVDIAEAPRTPADVIALGAGPSGNFAFNGFVAELLYFGRSLSASERSLLSEHLLDKWMR